MNNLKERPYLLIEKMILRLMLKGAQSRIVPDEFDEALSLKVDALLFLLEADQG